MEHNGDADTNNNWCHRYSGHSIDKGNGRNGNGRTNGDHPNYNINNIINTEKNLGYLWRNTLKR